VSSERSEELCIIMLADPIEMSILEILEEFQSWGEYSW